MATAAVKCAACGASVDLPMTPLASDLRQGVAIVSLDTAVMMRHVRRDCSAGNGTTSHSTEVAIPDVPAYVANGQRYCQGCRTPAPECLHKLRNGQGACCGMCAEGDTHPVPEARSDA